MVSSTSMQSRSTSNSTASATNIIILGAPKFAEPNEAMSTYVTKYEKIVVYLTSWCVNWAFFGTRGPF
jgi:hypothetical protein